MSNKNQYMHVDVYRQTLDGLIEALKVLRMLMKSDDEQNRMRAVQNYVDVADMAVTLAAYLGEDLSLIEIKDETNPLARRIRS